MSNHLIGEAIGTSSSSSLVLESAPETIVRTHDNSSNDNNIPRSEANTIGEANDSSLEHKTLPSSSGALIDKKEDVAFAEWTQHQKHFLVLSNAGKPIYSRYGDESQLTPLMGAIQALISSFADMNDAVRSMKTDRHTIVFYTNGPLYFLVVSNKGDPPDLLQSELRYLHSQIISILTSAQLTKIFEQRSNFDLRQLLGGMEGTIDQLIDRMNTDLSFSLGSLDTLWMRYRLRERIGNALLNARPRGLLYAMVITDMKLVTLLRPRKHSLHPSDLHILFNMASSKSFHSGEHWIPVCFPQFNDQGFLHVYVNYLSSRTALLLVSPDRDSFFKMSKCHDQIVDELGLDDTLQRLDDAASQFTLHPSEIGVHGLLQLYYKNKTLVQHFGTSFDSSISQTDQQQILDTYRRLRLYMSSDKLYPLRIVYHKTASNTVLAWQSSKFELYAAVAPNMDVKRMIRMVNSILEWVKNEEDHLFVLHSPSY